MARRLDDHVSSQTVLPNHGVTLSKEILVHVHKLSDPRTRLNLERALGWDPIYHPVLMPGIDFAQLIRSKVKPYAPLRNGSREAYKIVLQLPEHINTDSCVYFIHKSTKNYYKKKEDGTWEQKVLQDILPDDLNDYDAPSYVLIMETWIGRVNPRDSLQILWMYKRIWHSDGTTEWGKTMHPNVIMNIGL